MNTIRVMLVDDQNLVREGIKSLLALRENVEVSCEAQDGQQALTLLETQQVDVMLLDIRMPVMDGLAVLESLKAQNHPVNVLVLTTFDEHDLVLNSLKLGALGYLRKDVSLQTLIDAIETVANGQNWIQPAITTRVTSSKSVPPNDSSALQEPLSDIERQVLQLVAAGYSNHEIAEATHKSTGTVRNQVSSILSKLNVRDRTRAVLKAIDLGLI